MSEQAAAPAATPTNGQGSGNPFDAVFATTPDDGGGEPIEAADDAAVGDDDAGDDAATKEPAADGDDGKKYKIKVDGVEHEVTIEEMKKGYMRERTFTKKTQALATERRELAAQREKHAESTTKFKSFLRTLTDPNADPHAIVSRLERAGVPVKRLLARVVDDRIAEIDMPETEKIARERKRWNDEKAADEKRRNDEMTAKQHQAEVSKLSRQFEKWLPQALTEAKLPMSKDTKNLMRLHLEPIWQSGRAVTYEDFQEAATAAAADWVGGRASLDPDALVDEIDDEDKLRKAAVAIQRKLAAKKGTQAPAAALGGAGGKPVNRGPAKPQRFATMADEFAAMKGGGR